MSQRRNPVPGLQTDGIGLETKEGGAIVENYLVDYNWNPVCVL